jgi:hypothetical protein
MSSKLIKIFKSGGEFDLTKEVLELNKKVPDLNVSFTTSAMIEDANSNKEDIYKITRPIKSRKEIPKFIFL